MSADWHRRKSSRPGQKCNVWLNLCAKIQTLPIVCGTDRKVLTVATLSSNKTIATMHSTATIGWNVKSGKKHEKFKWYLLENGSLTFFYFGINRSGLNRTSFNDYCEKNRSTKFFLIVKMASNGDEKSCFLHRLPSKSTNFDRIFTQINSPSEKTVNRTWFDKKMDLARHHQYMKNWNFPS